MSRDWRDERIAQLERENAELREKQAAAVARIAELEEKLGKSSRNSGKPPSSDTPKQSAERRKKAAQITKPKGRKRGGQAGHHKYERQPVPAAEVTEHYDCIPEHCERCSKPLNGKDARPRLHQVFHLPKIVPIVFQYALHALRCRHCQHVTVGKLPSGVPKGAFGSSVIAAVALLMGACRLGKRPVQAVMADLFGVQMSLGAVVGCQQVASSAIGPAVDEAKQAVRRAGVKHSDETSWREGPKRSKVWLWTVVTGTITVFSIHKQRSVEAAQQLLGKVGGVLISDRFSAYGYWRLWMRQVCWAHLVRDFVAIAEREDDASTRIGDALLAEARRLFAWWHRVRDGTLKRATFQVYVRGLRKRVRGLLEEGRACANPKTARTCAQILKVEPALWLFVERKGIEPTNNIAERTLRHAVMWRKSSGGTHSELGSRFVERILTVVATLRQQNRNVLSFLHHACEAQLTGGQSPSLLPNSEASAALPKAA